MVRYVGRKHLGTNQTAEQGVLHQQERKNKSSADVEMVELVSIRIHKNPQSISDDR